MPASRATGPRIRRPRSSSAARPHGLRAAFSAKGRLPAARRPPGRRSGRLGRLASDLAAPRGRARPSPPPAPAAPWIARSAPRASRPGRRPPGPGSRSDRCRAGRTRTEPVAPRRPRCHGAPHEWPISAARPPATESSRCGAPRAHSRRDRASASARNRARRAQAGASRVRPARAQARAHRRRSRAGRRRARTLQSASPLRPTRGRRHRLHRVSGSPASGESMRLRARGRATEPPGVGGRCSPRCRASRPRLGSTSDESEYWKTSPKAEARLGLDDTAVVWGCPSSSKTGRSIQPKSVRNPVHQTTFAKRGRGRPRARRPSERRQPSAGAPHPPPQDHGIRISGSPCAISFGPSFRPRRVSTLSTWWPRKRIARKPKRARNACRGNLACRLGPAIEHTWLCDSSSAISAPRLPAPTTRRLPFWSWERDCGTRSNAAARSSDRGRPQTAEHARSDGRPVAAITFTASKARAPAETMKRSPSLETRSTATPVCTGRSKRAA